MAAESKHLPASVTRSAYLLIGECCELGADPLVWRNHLLTQLNQRLGAVASVIIDASVTPQLAGLGARVDVAVSANQYTPAENEILLRCVKQMRIEENPLGTRLLVHALSSGPVAAARQDCVSRSEWERSNFRNQYFVPLGWESSLISMLVKSPTNFQCMNFSRLKSDKEFSVRERRLLQLIVGELSQISELRLANRAEASLESLPLREKQVLLALADGDDEKQVAVRLGISRNTVHEYVRRLLRKFQVSSRSQLLLCVARQIHAWRISSIDNLDSLWIYRR